MHKLQYSTSSNTVEREEWITDLKSAVDYSTGVAISFIERDYSSLDVPLLFGE